MKMFELFKDKTICEVKSGNSTRLWEDNWNGDIMKMKFPELHSYNQQENMTSWAAKSVENYYSLFQLPLSTTAHHQFH